MTGNAAGQDAEVISACLYGGFRFLLKVAAMRAVKMVRGHILTWLHRFKDWQRWSELRIHQVAGMNARKRY